MVWGMQRVTIRSNWGYFDELDGRDLADGEGLRLKWPDGTITVAKVILVKTSEPGSDMGHPIDIPLHRAFIGVNYRGAIAQIRLYNSPVLCERILNV